MSRCGQNSSKFYSQLDENLALELARALETPPAGTRRRYKQQYDTLIYKDIPAQSVTNNDRKYRRMKRKISQKSKLTSSFKSPPRDTGRLFWSHVNPNHHLDNAELKYTVPELPLGGRWTSNSRFVRSRPENLKKIEKLAVH